VDNFDEEAEAEGDEPDRLAAVAAGLDGEALMGCAEGPLDDPLEEPLARKGSGGGDGFRSKESSRPLSKALLSLVESGGVVPLLEALEILVQVRPSIIFPFDVFFCLIRGAWVGIRPRTSLHPLFSGNCDLHH
jgi:hypothetical protein